MKARLEKRFRTTLGGGDFYTESFDFIVKVKRENTDWDPWERWFKCDKLNIEFRGWNKERPWSIQSRYNDMDECMTNILGDSLKSYPTRRAMFDDLKKLAEKWPEYYYSNGKEKRYEFAIS